MVTYLVTGAAGFIGSNLVKELLEKGATVRAVDNLTTGRNENIQEFLLHPEFSFHNIDIRERDKLRIVCKDVNVIFHQAALSSVQESIKSPTIFNKVNVQGTINVLEAAKECGVRKVVCASSAAVYGDNKQEGNEHDSKNESMNFNPLSPYAETKIEGEKQCELFSKEHGLSTICLRYFNVTKMKKKMISVSWKNTMESLYGPD